MDGLEEIWEQAIPITPEAAWEQAEVEGSNITTEETDPVQIWDEAEPVENIGGFDIPKTAREMYAKASDAGTDILTFIDNSAAYNTGKDLLGEIGKGTVDVLGPIAAGRFDVPTAVVETAQGLGIGFIGFMDDVLSRIGNEIEQLVLTGDVDFAEAQKASHMRESLYNFEPSDPLAHALLATIGAIPLGIETFANTLSDQFDNPNIKAGIQTLGWLGGLAGFGQVFKTMGRAVKPSQPFVPKADSGFAFVVPPKEKLRTTITTTTMHKKPADRMRAPGEVVSGKPTPYKGGPPDIDLKPPPPKPPPPSSGPAPGKPKTTGVTPMEFIERIRTEAKIKGVPEGPITVDQMRLGLEKLMRRELPPGKRPPPEVLDVGSKEELVRIARKYLEPKKMKPPEVKMTPEQITEAEAHLKAGEEISVVEMKEILESKRRQKLRESPEARAARDAYYDVLDYMEEKESGGRKVEWVEEGERSLWDILSDEGGGIEPEAWVEAMRKIKVKAKKANTEFKDYLINELKFKEDIADKMVVVYEDKKYDLMPMKAEKAVRKVVEKPQTRREFVKTMKDFAEFMVKSQVFLPGIKAEVAKKAVEAVVKPAALPVTGFLKRLKEVEKWAKKVPELRNDLFNYEPSKKFWRGKISYDKAHDLTMDIFDEYLDFTSDEFSYWNVFLEKYGHRIEKVKDKFTETYHRSFDKWGDKIRATPEGYSHPEDVFKIMLDALEEAEGKPRKPIIFGEEGAIDLDVWVAGIRRMAEEAKWAGLSLNQYLVKQKIPRRMADRIVTQYEKIEEEGRIPDTAKIVERMGKPSKSPFKRHDVLEYILEHEMDADMIERLFDRARLSERTFEKLNAPETNRLWKTLLESDELEGEPVDFIQNLAKKAISGKLKFFPRREMTDAEFMNNLKKLMKEKPLGEEQLEGFSIKEIASDFADWLKKKYGKDTEYMIRDTHEASERLEDIPFILPKYKDVSPSALMDVFGDRIISEVQRKLGVRGEEGAVDFKVVEEALRETLKKGKELVPKFISDVKAGRERKVREFTEKIRDEYLTPVEDNPLDKIAVAYLKSGEFKDYINNMPELGGINPRELFKLDPASKKMIAAFMVQTQKGRKLKPALRKTGFFGIKKFSLGVKDKPDISKRDTLIADPTRMIQAIDQGKFGGPAQEHILWPSRLNTLAKLRWIDEHKVSLVKILEKNNIKGKKQDRALGMVLDVLDKEMASLPIAEIMKKTEIVQALFKVKRKDHQNVVQTALDFRDIFNRLLDEQNQARGKRGQTLIKFRERYRPWIREANQLWEKIGVRINPKEVAERPEMPDFINPNAPFNARALARTAKEEYPKVKGATRLMSQYIETAGRDIFDTNTVQNNKVHAAILRGRGLKNGADAVDTWTAEVFAGVKPQLTRWTAKALPPKLHKSILQIRRNLTRAVFPLNWTWNTFIQTSSAGLTYMRYGNKAMVYGLRPFFDKKFKTALKENAYSHIIKTRRGGSVALQDVGDNLSKLRKIDASKMDKFEHYTNFLTHIFEEALTRHAVAAAYYDGMGKGLKGRTLWEYASEGGSKTQSMYNYQDIPGILRSREIGAVAPFQTFALEVLNTVREMDVPLLKKVTGRAGVYQTLNANSAAGKALLRKRLMKLARWGAAITVTNSVVDKMIGRKPWQLSSFIPFLNLWTGGPYTGKGPVHQQYYQGFRKGVEHLVKHGSLRALRKWFIMYHVPAGIQIERTLEGIEAVIDEEVRDVTGKRIIRIQPEDYLQAVTMGPFRTESGKEYIKKRRESQSILNLRRAKENIIHIE